jgi:hypothetical protein
MGDGRRSWISVQRGSGRDDNGSSIEEATRENTMEADGIRRVKLIKSLRR